MKHKTIMEPIHIFQINFMSLSIWLLCFQCIKIIQDLVNQNESCLFYIFGFFGLTSWNCDIVLMQIDRVLAIYWNLRYKSRVRTKMAIISCISSKFITMILSSIVFIYDETYFHCSHPLTLFHLKSSNVYMDAYPKLVVAGILLVVTIYVKLTMKNLEKKVQPVVNISRMETFPEDQERKQQCKTQVKIQRIDENPNMFYEVNVEVGRNKHEERSDPNCEGNANILPSVSGYLQKDKCEIKATKQEMNEAVNDSVIECEEIERDQKIQCFNPVNDIFLVAKAALTMNLITSLLVIVMVPSSVLQIIYQNCSQLTGDCGNYIFIHNLMSPVRALCAFIHPVWILKKIDQI